MTRNCFYKKNSKKGIILFVVLGAIFVLSVLVMSYNFFVRGKFNESREILKHVRATKCAQSLCKYIIYLLQKDLNEPNSALKEIFKENALDKMKEVWYSGKKDDCDTFVKALLIDTVKNEEWNEIDTDVNFEISDLVFLNKLKTQPNYEDYKDDLFFDFEKVGRITIKVEIKIGHTREVWYETRPFKVVFPFPIPITKFNFYWKDGPGSDEEYSYNKVVLKSNGKYSKDNKPFLFDNGSYLSINNKDEDVWKKRGWIYIGGNNKLNLNRGAGNNSFGQNFYSFPRDLRNPPALVLNFDNEIVSELEKIDDDLSFRMASWGFSESLINPESNKSWKEILKSDYINHDESEVNYWNSSCLHIFSRKDMAGTTQDDTKDPDALNPTITRVIGNVNDRFVEMGYLLNTSKTISAAVIDLSETDFKNANKGGDSNSENGEDYYPFGSYLYTPDKKAAIENMGPDKFLELSKFFNAKFISVDKDYKDASNPTKFTYYQVMSKIRTQSLSEVYDTIAQYSKDKSKIDIPAKKTAPKIDDKKFWSSDISGMGDIPSLFNKLGADKDKIKESCDKICEPKDTTFGLGLRKCYEIRNNHSETISKIFSASGGSGLNLNNLVVEVLSDSSELINIGGDEIKMKSAGAIFRKEGALQIGDFQQENEPFANPLLLLTGKGEIKINNTAADSEVRAYIIALGEGGTVKTLNSDNPLKIIGGMAVKEFRPDNLPKSGGYLQYNTNLDPTNEGDGEGNNKNPFLQYIGVALGPKGGRL